MKKEIKEYFQNCKYAVQAPGAFFIEGNKCTGKVKVLPVPLYAYAGIEIGNFKKFSYEEKDVSDSVKDTEKDIINFSNFQNFSLCSIDRRNRLFYFNEYLSEINDDFDKSLKIKVWSDIPPNVGFNESSAIASAIALLLLFTYAKETGEREQILKFENLKKEKQTCGKVALDYNFGKIFFAALSFDFFSNGAAILASLLGLSKEEEIIDYECLTCEQLKDSLKVNPKVGYERLLDRDIFLQYKERCGYLSHRFSEDGTPLYKWDYTNLSSILRQTGQIEVSVINKYNHLDNTMMDTKLNDAKVKCFMIYPFSVGIFGSNGRARFYKKHLDPIFKKKKPKMEVPVYGTYYDSWKKGWEIEGARLLDSEEYKLPKPPKGVVMVDEGSKFGKKELEAEKAEYEAWDIKGRKPAFKKGVKDLKSKKGKLDIFVDEDGIVYFGGEKVNELKKTQILYDFLLYFLKNKGIGGTYRELFVNVWEKGDVSVSFTMDKYKKGNVIRMKNRLNTLLKDYEIKGVVYEYSKYRFPEDLEFCIIEKYIYEGHNQNQ